MSLAPRPLPWPGVAGRLCRSRRGGVDRGVRRRTEDLPRSRNGERPRQPVGQRRPARLDHLEGPEGRDAATREAGRGPQAAPPPDRRGLPRPPHRPHHRGGRRGGVAGRSRLKASSPALDGYTLAASAVPGAGSSDASASRPHRTSRQAEARTPPSHHSSPVWQINAPRGLSNENIGVSEWATRAACHEDAEMAPPRRARAAAMRPKLQRRERPLGAADTAGRLARAAGHGLGPL